jgi:hypothetical protein
MHMHSTFSIFPYSILTQQLKKYLLIIQLVHDFVLQTYTHHMWAQSRKLYMHTDILHYNADSLHAHYKGYYDTLITL